jgi:hypothetical protein
MAGGITITARYTIASDGCGARAEPDDESRPPPLPGIPAKAAGPEAPGGVRRGIPSGSNPRRADILRGLLRGPIG